MASRSRRDSLIVAALGLIPLAHLLTDFATDGFGPEPVEEILHRTGEWALRLLLLSLAVTPLRRAFGWPRLAPQRRTLGLLSFLYAALHFATYLVFELELRFAELASEVAERPYITAGFSAFVILAALASTSTRGWMRRLGRRWRTLHRGVYVAVVAAAVHFVWSVKADLVEPLIYAAVAMVLLMLRWPRKIGPFRRPGAPTGPPGGLAPPG